MKFTDSALVEELYNIYLEMECNFNAIYEVTQESLAKIPLRQARYKKDIMLELIQKDYLYRIIPANASIPFTCKFTSKGIQALQSFLNRKKLSSGLPFI